MDQKTTFRAWAEELKGGIIQRQSSRGIKASGKSAESLRIEYHPEGKGFKLFGAGSFFFQEYGRGPSGQGEEGEGPSLQVRIRGWIDDKGIIPIDITKDSLAFLISRKIHEEGTLLYNGKAQKVGIEETIQEMIKKYRAEVRRTTAIAYRTEILKGILK